MDPTITISLNEEHMKVVLNHYKENFETRWNNQKFKWEAVDTFAQNWNPDPDDERKISEMIEKSLSGAGKLLNYPLKLQKNVCQCIVDYIDNDGNKFHELFDSLFKDDGEKNAFERIEEFDNLLSVNITKPATTLLWLKFPNEYYITDTPQNTVKIGRILDENFSEDSEKVILEDSIESVQYFYALHDKMREYIKEKGTAFIEALDIKHKLSNAGIEYKDEEFVTLTNDIGYYVVQYYEKINKLIGEREGTVEEEELVEKEEQVMEATENQSDITNGANILIYGVPGVGKSSEVKRRIEAEDRKGNVERIVFFPDYTYSDFIGQIMPKLIEDGSNGGKLTYEFNPGPLTRILKCADQEKEKMHFLIVEEINRGNAPAIFGDIFQLLDRDEKGKSKFPVRNADIAKYVYGDENADVYLPGNLTIYATMNTSDQNVFALDTAFQRRWELELLLNELPDLDDISSDSEREVYQYTENLLNKKIEGSDVTWGKFLEGINDMILEKNSEMLSSEDMRLGMMFVREDELSKDKFPQKVLKYLWDDAFKMCRSDVFCREAKSLEDIVKMYAEGSGDPLANVFKEEIYSKFLSDEGDADAR